MATAIKLVDPAEDEFPARLEAMVLAMASLTGRFNNRLEIPPEA